MRFLGAIVLIVIIAALLWFVRPGSRPIETIEATLENSILSSPSSEEDDETTTDTEPEEEPASDDALLVDEPEMVDQGIEEEDLTDLLGDDPYDTEADDENYGEDDEFIEPGLLAMAEGPGRDLVFYSCTSCHGPEMYLAVGKTREEWSETLDVMERDRAMYPLEEEDREIILDYLASNYGP